MEGKGERRGREGGEGKGRGRGEGTLGVPPPTLKSWLRHWN